MTVWQFLTVLRGPIGLGVIGFAVFQLDRREYRRKRTRSEQTKASGQH